MIVKGIEFPFSALNANDVDRMNAATHQSTLDAAAEKQRVQQGGITDISDVIRGQCRILHSYLETLLGAGACQKLGLDGSDLNQYRAVVEEVARSVAAELGSLHRETPAAPVELRVAKPPHSKKKHKKQGGHR